MVVSASNTAILSRPQNGDTPLDLARQRGRTKVVALLERVSVACGCCEGDVTG